MPYYPINTKGSDKLRVVEADNPAAALRHAADSMFTVGKPMKPADIVPYMTNGGTVEKVGEAATQAAGDQ